MSKKPEKPKEIKKTYYRIDPPLTVWCDECGVTISINMIARYKITKITSKEALKIICPKSEKVVTS